MILKIEKLTSDRRGRLFSGVMTMAEVKNEWGARSGDEMGQGRSSKTWDEIDRRAVEAYSAIFRRRSPNRCVNSG